MADRQDLKKYLRGFLVGVVALTALEVPPFLLGRAVGTADERRTEPERYRSYYVHERCVERLTVLPPQARGPLMDACLRDMTRRTDPSRAN